MSELDNIEYQFEPNPTAEVIAEQAIDVEGQDIGDAYHEYSANSEIEILGDYATPTLYEPTEHSKLRSSGSKIEIQIPIASSKKKQKDNHDVLGDPEPKTPPRSPARMLRSRVITKPPITNERLLRRKPSEAHLDEEPLAPKQVKGKGDRAAKVAEGVSSRTRQKSNPAGRKPQVEAYNSEDGPNFAAAQEPINSLAEPAQNEDTTYDPNDHTRDTREGSEAQESGGETAEEDLELNSEPLIKFTSLKKLLRLAQMAGQTKSGTRANNILLDLDKELLTRHGKVMKRLLKALNRSYQKLQDARYSGDNEGLENIHANLDAYMVELETEVRSLLVSRLRIPEDSEDSEYKSPKFTKEILQDLYFTLIPQFLGVIVICARAKPLQKSMDTADLENSLFLIQTLFELVSAACDKPPSHQLNMHDLKGNYGTKTLRIQLPAISLRPELRIIIRTLKLELRRREYRKEVARANKVDRENRQKRVEQEEREEIEHRHNIREIHRRQRAAFDEHIMRGDPKWAFLLERRLKDNGAKPHTANQYNSSQKVQEDERYLDQNLQAEVDRGSEGNHHSNYDDDFQRVHVFPSNNQNDGLATKPWTWEERCAFIDLMQEHRGIYIILFESVNSTRLINLRRR
jgi:hypothetical protein